MTTGSINAQRIGAGTFYKLLLVGTTFVHIILVLLVMLGVLVGAFNPTDVGESMPIWKSELILFGYLIVGLIFIPVWAGIYWLGIYPGIWCFSLLKPMTLSYKSTSSTD